MQVSDVLRDRLHEPDGLERMIAVSIVAHIVFASALVFGRGWLTPVQEAPRTVMTITLAGGGISARSGTTAIGGRPVQQETPPDAPKRPEVQQAPAAKAAEMTVPEKNARRATGANVREAPDDARGRTPTKGAQTAAGSAAAFTGARGQGFGLSGGGGPGLGATLDVGDFCCPQYLIDMRDRIQRNWNDRQNIPAEVVVRFVIARNGDLTDAKVERSSGYSALDLEALRAVELTKQLAALPAQYPYQTLPVHLTFQYQK